MYNVGTRGSEIRSEVDPAFIANSTFIVTSFTWVMEFQKGRLQNLYWKRDVCAKAGEVQWAVVLGFSWRFPALISTWRFSTRGMKLIILSSILFMVCIQTSRAHLQISSIISSELLVELYLFVCLYHVS
ncbi:hypothetical protein AT3G48630 [Arabidopsis thaliana]|uniref:Uncharacterized protein n=1 Tax=Arabidopsis thaliana TaxID=3702 RepID=F4JF36_ARATH|nr:uncharacterized protein AT3G48630 [Arabidopsis thaliana]AEE78439.1 hypothetical protein AT3G48630 [Arabidopsis thaliana]|eukprot:NP_190432.4 hypothetical protein AT3G48630 [Arabidopsis thaliana]